MNVNEFERNKPRKTYREISALEEELETCLDHCMNTINTEYILNKIRKIKEVFLTGE